MNRAILALLLVALAAAGTLYWFERSAESRPRAERLPHRAADSTLATPAPDATAADPTRPCAGVARVSVIVRSAALPAAGDRAGVERELHAVARRLLAPLGARVAPGPIDLSPAIRAFRFAAPDSAAARAAIAELAARPEVEAAELDACGARIDR